MEASDGEEGADEAAAGPRPRGCPPSWSRSPGATSRTATPAPRYLFRGSTKPDGPINPDTAERWTKKAFEAAGIQYGRDTGEGLTLHSLRHSHATILLSRGASIATGAERLGDTQKVVLDYYAHVLPRDEKYALLVLDGVVPTVWGMNRLDATLDGDRAQDGPVVKQTPDCGIVHHPPRKTLRR